MDGVTLYLDARTMLEVPEEFRQPHPFQYPENNDVIFEDWYYRNWTPGDARERIYIPINWTSYYCANNYGADRRKMHELQNFVSTIDRSKKYYTIIQYDNGLKTNLRGMDCKIFAMSGGKTDYPLPLVMKPHPYEFDDKRTILANFVGGLTHPVRKTMYRWFKNKSGFYYSYKRVDTYAFCKLLSRSVFTLCPRGFGPSSFRIAEALQYGSIPVYISDEFVLPHDKPFDYGIMCKISQLRGLEAQLRGMNEQDLHQMRENGKRAFKELFSYEGCKKLILENVDIPVLV